MNEKTEIREAMAQYHHNTNMPGLVYGALDLAGYAGCVIVLSAWPGLLIAVPVAVIQTIFIVRLFVLGHDACHGALFRPRIWNKILGRVFFWPSLTPYSLWELGHNTVHHGFSNLKGRDYVWTPLSPQEWLRLPCHRRILERLYRSPWGLGLYYFLEIWWKRMFFPRRSSMSSYRPAYVWDNLLSIVFLFAQAGAVYLLAPSGARRAAAVWFAIILPFLLWNYLMGFAIYCHHTHPDVGWFDRRADWSYYQAQVCSTTHTRFPGGTGWLLHNIFEHTAHHVDTGIPFYNLCAAQTKLEELCRPGDVRDVMFSPGAFVERMRLCQLYDYGNHCWLSFEDAEQPWAPVTQPSIPAGERGEPAGGCKRV